MSLKSSLSYITRTKPTTFITAHSKLKRTHLIPVNHKEYISLMC